MKKIFITIILFLILYNLTIAQEPAENFVLDNKHTTGETYIYTARDFIRLEPGFEYTAQASDYFLAQINPNLIFPVDYNKPRIPWNDKYAVGSLPGQAAVSPTGAATYQIPINVVPRTAGIQPNLSIVYNSQSPGGILGTGWSINGFSVISRVPANKYYNNIIDPIDFDDNDQFALDGQRLIKVGDEYRTEIESFSRIIPIGTSGNGPLKFKIITKNGSELYYAYEEDSRIQTTLQNNGTVNFWLLDKIIDPAGNYMTISYIEKDGYFYPDEINYTGNINTKTDPYNKIKFYYAERIDKSFSYIAGGVVYNKYLLRKIKVISENAVIRTYDFKYQKNINSQLKEIILTNQVGKKTNTTKIDWFNAQNDFEISNGNWEDDNVRSQLFADISGNSVPISITAHYIENITQISINLFSINFNNNYSSI